MSGPIEFIEYRCGHAAPVHGQGAVVTRLCPACTENLAPHAGLNAWMVIQPRTNITKNTILGHVHPSAYCDCDMCQSRIP